MRDGMDLHVADFDDYHFSDAAIQRNVKSYISACKMLYNTQNQRGVFDFEAKKILVNNNVQPN